MLVKLLYVGIGGFIGSILRYLCYYYFSNLNFKSFFATLFVNSFGSFLLGIVVFFSINKDFLKTNSYIYLFISFGILGAFTTFTAFNYDNLIFLIDKNYSLLFLNIFLNLFLSLTLVIFSYNLLLRLF